MMTPSDLIAAVTPHLPLPGIDGIAPFSPAAMEIRFEGEVHFLDHTQLDLLIRGAVMEECIRRQWEIEITECYVNIHDSNGLPYDRYPNSYAYKNHPNAITMLAALTAAKEEEERRREQEESNA